MTKRHSFFRYFFAVLFFNIVYSSIYGQGFTISSFTTDMELTDDGKLKIKETIDVVFQEKKRGIFRYIPLHYSVNGKSHNISVSDISVDGRPYKISTENNQKHIRIGDPEVYITGPQSYTINYTLNDIVTQWDDYQELYIDVTGDGWPTPIQNTNFTLSLPKDITISPNQMRITGGSSNDGEALTNIEQTNQRTINGRNFSPISKGNSLTFAVKLPIDYVSKAVVASNDTSKSRSKTPQKPWLAIIPLSLLAAILTFWKSKRKTYQTSLNQEITVYPPQGFTSAHIGAFIDGKANTRDLVSLLPYWASEGYITISGSGDDTVLHKKKSLPADFPSYEHKIFNRIFEVSDTSDLLDLHQKFYPILEKAKSELCKEIHNQEYYDEGYKKFFSPKLVIPFGLFTVAVGVFILVMAQQWLLGILMIFVGIGIILLLAATKPLSLKGQRFREELKSFERFIKNPDGRQLAKLMKEDSKYFEKVLPFAVAFGYEKAFMKNFEGLLTTAPVWYTNGSTTSGNFAEFTNAFTPESINSAFSSTPPPSPSGSGGGGFSSGGGFGGGGGGSW